MPKAASHIAVLSGLLLALILSTTALAQTVADIRVERSGATARVIVDYEDSAADVRPNATVAVEYSVLVISLSEPLQADVSALAEDIGPLAARARLDADGATIRIALTGPVETRTSSSYDQIAIDLAPPGTPALAPIVSPREQAEREAGARAAEIAAKTRPNRRR